MTINDVVEQIHVRSTDFFTPARNGTFVCPICGSGSGSHHTGVTKCRDGIHFTCWRGCYTAADVIDIAGLMHGIPVEASDPDSFRQKVGYAAEALGISYDATVRPYKAVQPAIAGKAGKSTPEKRKATDDDEELVDYLSFYRQCEQRLGDTGYHRGISEETLHRFMVGYAPSWRHPKRPSDPDTPRLIIPISRYYYLARYAEADPPEELVEYAGEFAKLKVGRQRGAFFNGKAVDKADRPICVVEGEIDAMSIIDAGGEAVALDSCSMAGRFLSFLEEHRPRHPLVVALDDDDAGKEAQERLCAGLEERGISYVTADLSAPYKDANELLEADRDALVAAVAAAEAKAKEKEQADQEAKLEEIRQLSAGYHLQEFIDGIDASINTPYYPTGFTTLDSLLDGGLYEGLYTIGAVTSLGKSTLVLQIADQIAQAGKEVLYISLEMARSELMAKSISRESLLECMDSDTDLRLAKTNRGITTGSRYALYTAEEKELIQRAMVRYAGYADNIYIVEGVGDVGTAEIRQEMQRFSSLTGEAPVLVVDYVQILQSPDSHLSDKQAIDRSVLELKRISRDYKTPVIAISSFNRSSYSKPVSLEAFKESGALEYGSDVLIGLQLQGTGEDDFDAEAAAAKTPCDVELKILKNRNGRKGTTCLLEYYKLFNYFQEAGE